jgi:nitrate reductase NapE component
MTQTTKISSWEAFERTLFNTSLDLYANFTASSTDRTPPLDRKHQVAHKSPEMEAVAFITMYLFPVVIFVGTIGNILSLLTLTRRRMRTSSVYVYLAVLACVDTSALYLSAFKTWLRFVSGFELLHISDAGCKIITFLFLVSSCH